MDVSVCRKLLRVCAHLEAKKVHRDWAGWQKGVPMWVGDAEEYV